MSTGRNPSWGPRHPQRPRLLQLFTRWVTFPATQVPSSDPNTLDDYEENDNTQIALTFVTPGDLAVTYSKRLLEYTKTGRGIEAQFSLITSAFTHTTAAGNLLLTGFPFTSGTTSLDAYIGTLQWQGITKAGYTSIVGRVASNSTQMNFVASGSGLGAAQVVAGDVPTGGTVSLHGSVFYRT
jgi:hypothetical protein